MNFLLLFKIAAITSVLFAFDAIGYISGGVALHLVNHSKYILVEK